MDKFEEFYLRERVSNLEKHSRELLKRQEIMKATVKPSCSIESEQISAFNAAAVELADELAFNWPLAAREARYKGTFPPEPRDP